MRHLLIAAWFTTSDRFQLMLARTFRGTGLMGTVARIDDTELGGCSAEMRWDQPNDFRVASSGNHAIHLSIARLNSGRKSRLNTFFDLANASQHTRQLTVATVMVKAFAFSGFPSRQ